MNRDNNSQIFTVFEHILKNPKGITYEALAKKLKTDVINISHYCCKLKKIKFVDWDHKSNGVIVFPKLENDKNAVKYQKEEEF